MISNLLKIKMLRISKWLFVMVIMVSLFSITSQVIAQGFDPSSSPVPQASQVGGQINTNQVGGNISGGTFTLQNPLKINSIGGLVKNFVEIFSYVVILFAVLALIYVGFQYIVASAEGNSNKIKDLHSWLLWIVVGVAVVIGARVIVEIVINTLGLTGTISPGVINSANNALRP